MDTTPTPHLSQAARRQVIAIVRATLEAWLREGRRPPVDTAGLPELTEKGAAFVTLRTTDDELRGCIGTTVAEEPLGEVVQDLAISSATRDRRFHPVTAGELADLVVEVSVLSPLAPADLDRIEIGKHGLVVRGSGRSGLLLPQVASERGWDKETFLRHTCDKAGLPEDAWQKPGTSVLWFTCDVIDEHALRGGA